PQGSFGPDARGGAHSPACRADQRPGLQAQHAGDQCPQLLDRAAGCRAGMPAAAEGLMSAAVPIQSTPIDGPALSGQIKSAAPEQAAHHGRIAQYALGDDYHDVIKGKLHQLADWIRQRAPEAQTRACVDTAPVMEKELSARAGVGWLGKNCCTINETIGSWLL